MTKKKAAFQNIKSAFTVFLFIIISFLMSDEIRNYSHSGLRLAFEVIIPTVFPFMVFSDAVSSQIRVKTNGKIAKVYERIFNLSFASVSALICGVLGGFPVGARNAVKLLDDGIVSKDECERLMCFSNIPSIAYTVFAVGAGFCSSYSKGLALYLITLLSSLFTGFIIGIKKNYSVNSTLIEGQTYDFVSSVKSGALSSMNIAFFISFFSVISGLVKKYFIIPLSAAFVLPLLEVGNAILHISELHNLKSSVSMAIIAFSLSFSGISVIMQSLSFCTKNKVSIKKVLLYKLIQGVIAFILAYIVFSII